MRVLAELPSWAVDLGAAAAIVAAVIGATCAVARTPVARPFVAVGRWVWTSAGAVAHLIVVDPIARWLTGIIGEAVESSPLSKRVSAHMSSEDEARKADQREREAERNRLAGRLDKIDERLDDGSKRMAALEAGHSDIRTLLEDTLSELKAGNPEVR